MSKATPENLYQRSGVWWVHYYEGGRRIRRSLHTRSLREAKRLRDQLMGKRNALQVLRDHLGIDTGAQSAPPLTFGEVADRQLLDLESQDKPPRPQTMAIYRGIRNKWLARFDAKALGAITREDVKRLIRDVRAANVGDHQRCSVFRRLRAVFLFARREAIYMGPDPTDIPNPPRGGKPRDVALSPDQVGALIKALRDIAKEEPYQRRLAVMVELAWYTGLRWGEACGLRWDDLDLVAGRLQLQRSYRDELKSAASAKPIMLHTDAVALLRRWRLETPGEWVFPRRAGRPLKRPSSSDQKWIAAAARKAEIPAHVTSHVIRHSFGTALYRELRDPVATKQAMRHASIRTTMTTYVKEYDEEAQVEQINRLPKPRLLKAT